MAISAKALVTGLIIGLLIGGASSWFIRPRVIEKVTETVLGPTVTEIETIPGPTETVTETISGPTVTVTKTVMPTPTPTPTPEEYEIAYDDGEMDRSTSFGTGHAVRFTPPTKPWMLEKVKVYGQRYGEDKQFRIEIWDENFNPIYKTDLFDYSQYFTTSFGWAEIGIPSVEVGGDFYVCFFGYTKPDYGVWIGTDTDPPHEGRSVWFPRPGQVSTEPTEGFDPGKEDWMIRAVGHTPA